MPLRGHSNKATALLKLDTEVNSCLVFAIEFSSTASKTAVHLHSDLLVPEDSCARVTPSLLRKPSVAIKQLAEDMCSLSEAFGQLSQPFIS